MKVQKNNCEKNKVKKFNCIWPKLRASDGYFIIESNSNFTDNNVKRSWKFSFRVIF